MNWLNRIFRTPSSYRPVDHAPKRESNRSAAAVPQVKPRGPLRDRREELGTCVDDLKGWGGLTVDFIAAKLVTQDAAVVAFETLSARARQNVSGRGVVVVYGSLAVAAQSNFVAGIICPVWDAETNMRWFGDTTIEGLVGRPVKLADQNREQFGWQDSPLTVYDFVAVQVSS